jgi:hypothetical protein
MTTIKLHSRGVGKSAQTFLVALALCAGCSTAKSREGTSGNTEQADTSGLANIASGQIGCGPCGDTGDNGHSCNEYYNSCNEAWCADFVKWAWDQAGFPTDGINACSGSFYDYGVANHTLHFDNPQVGDAIVWNYGEECGGRHVEIVVDVSGGVVTGLSGNNGNGVVGRDYPCSSQGPCNSYGSGWILSGFISPVGGGNPPPPGDPCSGLGDGYYCGHDPSYGAGHSAPNTLYHCVGNVTADTQSCNAGCSIAPGSQDDYCNGAGPDPCASIGDGYYCGNDPSYSGGRSDPKTLYHCAGNVTAGTRSCPSGCTIAPGNQDDYCN